MKPSHIVLGGSLASFVLLAGGVCAQAITEFSAGITPGAGPTGITAGPDGNLWFAESTGNRIGRITPQGVVTEFSAGITAGAAPYGITAGPDGNLWFTEYDGDRIGRITPQGVVTEFSAGITAGAHPNAITAGPDGNLWFTEAVGGRIGRITPIGVVTEFSAGIGSTIGWHLNSITAGPDGNLWFAELHFDFWGNPRGRIGRMTPLGVVTEFNVASAKRITTGHDGNLWFIDYYIGTRNLIGRITPQGVVTVFYDDIIEQAWLDDITAGPDGNLWFTEYDTIYPGIGAIGRITPLGRTKEFRAGLSTYPTPTKIAAGPDGALWFTEYAGSRIGRIEPPPIAVSSARTFVASNGLDSNYCTLQNPCRQLAAALLTTASGGEIVVLDSADYAPVAIYWPVTIVAPPGVHPSISVPSGHGIDVDTLASKVTLRGLTINGAGGDVGINLVSGKALYIEDCVVTGFTNAGLQAISSTAGSVYVRDSAFRDNVNGALFGLTPGAFVVADVRLLTYIERSVFENNAAAGIRFTGGNLTIGITNATITDSVLAGGTWGLDVSPIGGTINVDVRGTRIARNAASGLRVGSAAGPLTVLDLASSEVSGNGIGIETLTGGTTAYVTDTTITANMTGITHVAGSAVSFGDNRLTRNGANGTFTSTAPKQ